MEHFAGKVAVVTGAATGIGRQAALSFAEAGAQVALLDTVVSAAEDTAHEIERLGAKAIVLRTDVSRDEDVRQAIDMTVETFGRLDIAFNNAGIALRGSPAADMDEGEWDRTIAVNLKGVWLCLKHECRHMLQSGGGAIVNTSSIMGLVSGPGLAAYSASKSGVVGLTKAVAIDYASRGIRVNAVCPGGIGNTAITDRPENRDDMARLMQATPMARLGEPRDIAETVMWLCSPAARFVTGQSIAVDGGFIVW
ncbi:MAG: glucose 1-dehydrogenase [Burkholderia sp.]|jgi:NAD(P)-dependent dehydrogenase (short-subunit alcohol dehydrogenase family)|uniref:SDR family NAD(P)-dependent oxidoreductase n=1 Tax=Burkholderia TaxID=32008 RepID=UPI001CF195AB|nr:MULTISPECIES: glucose 1-dehydrogenase [Burkholderia]MCA3778815.1 glucose 1-dehydrogenase [Burkholderia sp.]MCA3787155.1 glucose 1-dehydrogenase [Burkholderia sp.]MCA3791986.1 glucose 1-dehydrogenase [Burkholderia sp.]MCA3800618.1 glucose 1-dehydrogenase [Burkholderia sp.]MCA3808902.1 glucose 1-dehydrogenase [Burkholderia sp.]